MTAVEWFALNARKLRIQLEKKEITIGEFAVEHYNLLDKAKEMEKQQKIDFAEAFYDSLFQDAESYHNYLELKK